MKYEDIIDRENNSPTILSESISANLNTHTDVIYDSSSICEEERPIVFQNELDAECYTLAESKSRLKAKVHTHFLNV